MKLNEKQKYTILKIIISGEIQLFCYLFYLVIPAKSGIFVWTFELLRASLAGTFMQIINLVFLINGIILFLYIVVFLILFLTG